MENHEYGSLNGLRVLVMNDDQIMRQYICYILAQWDVSADVALNAKDALEMISKKIYDVMLFEPTMPMGDAYEVTRAIRSMEGVYFRDLPVLVFSRQPDTEKLAEFGFTGCFTDIPWLKDNLYMKISPYLKQTHNS